MLTITYAKYDLIDEKAEQTEIEENFKYPTIEEAQELLDKEDGLLTILTALYNTTDKEYRKSLQQFLYSEVQLVDREENNPITQIVKGRLSLSYEKNIQILEKVKNMDFQLSVFYPTKQDILDFVKDNTEENLAFLYWVLNAANLMELTKDEIETQEFIKNIISRRVKYGGNN